MRIAIVIGHTPRSPGAVNKSYGVSEYQFNSPLAVAIQARLNQCGHTAFLIYRDMPNDYQGLPDKVNAQNPEVIISLHANGAESQAATGTEMLYWESSTSGKALAEILQAGIHGALGLRDRGLKPISSASERGGHLLYRTKAPCVICEPFFITSNMDYERAVDRKDKLISAYVEALMEWAAI